ncbi:hypothetical protein F5Y11DRAFT_352149 [Daldinia sp. FL1419]|nr:hypothetical protein F5Y11DRAFT_352149 [Daldinia sp. FL1419]
MSYRTSRSDVDDRYYEAGPPRRAPARDDDLDLPRRRSPPRRAPVREYEDIDIQVRERERERNDRTPAFLREDARRTEAGPLVLRQREVETVDRRRPRSPSPIRYRERIVERDRERAPSMPPERRPRFIERTPSPSPPPTAVRVESRTIERRRERSPTPDRERDREHIRLRIEREREKERAPSPSPSPPPPPPAPPVIRGPTIEREVITHYRDIDHGLIRAKPPTPPPPPRTAPPQTRERDLDIDIDIRRSETDVDIRERTRSRSRPRERPRPRRQPTYYDEDDLVIERDHDILRVDSRRRAHSAAPPPRPDYEDEAEYITDKIDSRGRIGEAWNGATKDWTIVDVPPGTERVKMDGAGGAAAEVTWQRYSGVRRSKFIPEREGTPISAVSEPIREREPSRERERLSIQVYDKRERSRDREVEVEEIQDRRISIRDGDRAPPRKRNEMWTEITKDLVTREAIERMGYEYEETEWFFYVMQYLRYEDVLELVNMSDDIRRVKRRRAEEERWSRDWDRRHRHRHSLNWDTVDDERIVEREVVYDRPSHRSYVR